eukprot:879847-Amphidinium_carterae.1
MAEEDKKQYVTVLHRGQCTVGTLGLTRPQQEQSDSPHWRPSVHREAEQDDRSMCMGITTIQRCSYTCSINCVGWVLQSQQHLLEQWLQLEVQSVIANDSSHWRG